MVENWYKNWFGNDYLTVYAHRDDHEALQLIALIQKQIELKPNARILDVCCGQGRHAIHLAQLGYNVFGIDLSRTLLEVAKFQNEIGHAYFIQSDMRWLPVKNTFDLVLNLFTSFGYFENDQENQRVFLEFRSALNSSGNFVFDYFNSAHVIENLVPFHKEQIGDVVVEQERTISGSRVKKRIHVMREGKTSTFYESVKLYSPKQIRSMLDKAGLKVKHIFGDYDGSPLKENSSRMIVFGGR
ncbi:MAG: class I SAM-dependent methyltransferase [Calditrichales bacterium]|nr:MAG: class I SAM-dependent methyltransferase [Calditrichales bacterium]